MRQEPPLCVSLKLAVLTVCLETRIERACVVEIRWSRPQRKAQRTTLVFVCLSVPRAARDCVQERLCVVLDNIQQFMHGQTPIATAMVLHYRFYCIFVYHVLIILDLCFASWAAVRA